LEANVIPEQLGSDDQLGNVALGETELAIGALGDDDAGTDAGALYVAELPGNPPTAAFTASPTSGKVPLTVRFEDNSQGQITSWLWDFGNGYLSTLRDPVFTFQEVGTFTVTLTISGPCGSEVLSKDNFIQVEARGPRARPR